jgi:hypothetical protein
MPIRVLLIVVLVWLSSATEQVVDTHARLDAWGSEAVPLASKFSTIDLLIELIFQRFI